MGMAVPARVGRQQPDPLRMYPVGSGRGRMEPDPGEWWRRPRSCRSSPSSMPPQWCSCHWRAGRLVGDSAGAPLLQVAGFFAGGRVDGSRKRARLFALFCCRAAVPIQLPAAVVPPARRRRKAYRPPEMLLNLHVLDLMEVSGSQMRAACSLSMHQTTVSRWGKAAACASCVWPAGPFI